jgi:DNA end-binding protein Ku
VSIPVKLYAAHNSAANVPFLHIHKPSGKRVQCEKSVAGIGPVKAEDIVKGYESNGDYLLIDPAKIGPIRLETKKTVELVQFVGACEILPLYFDKPYYLVPTDELAEDAYRVIRDALRVSEKVGMGQKTMRGKEYLVAIEPCGDGLLPETLC